MARESAKDRRKRAASIVGRLRRLYPDARLALDFRSPLELLVALILAAQCTDDKVNEVTRSLFAKYRSPNDYVKTSRAELEKDIHPTGFYRNKAKLLQNCCQGIIDRFDGEVPAELEDLLSLAGVGRKTANILRGNAFGVPAIGVDTHVARLSQRLGFSRNTDPDKIEADLTDLIRRSDWIRVCHLLQRHGRRVCFARKPRCPECRVFALCPYPEKTPPAPKPSRRKEKRPGLMPGG